jgi:peptidyl-prolyl cis-trans isomerase B (cyclophilin B)
MKDKKMKAWFLIFFLLFSCQNKDGEAKAIITVPQGKIKIAFFKKEAPKHVANFIKLAENGHYDGTTFHRIIRGFVIQGGDYQSKDNYIFNDGTGDMGYTLKSEEKLKHFRGAIAAAKRGEDVNPEHRSDPAQFYVALDSLPNLDEQHHTVFGYVEEGMEVFDKMLELMVVYADDPNSGSKKVTEMEIEIIYE